MLSTLQLSLICVFMSESLHLLVRLLVCVCVLGEGGGGLGVGGHRGPSALFCSSALI